MAGLMGLWVAAVLFAGGALAQKPGTVEGAVSNSVTSAPIKKALVTLRNVNRNEGYQALSDAAGHFRFDNVKPGEYGLWAEASGYVREPARFYKPAVTVAEDKTATDCSIKLEPLGTITGRVLDETGEPVAGARVAALTYNYKRSGRFLNNYSDATTNGSGEYRLFGLQAGRWYLRVDKKLPDTEATGRVHRTAVEAEYGYTYFPGVTREDDAAAIDMPPGAEISQIEIRIRKTRVYHVRGKVIDGRSSQPMPNAEVKIQDVGNIPSHEAGVFDSRGIAPGVYRIAATGKADAWLYSPVQDVVITDHDVNDLALRLEPGFVVQGMAMAENSSASALKNVRVSLEPLGGMFNADPGSVKEDGTFTIANVPAQRYRVVLEQVPDGMYLKSVRLGSQDCNSDAQVQIGSDAQLTLVFASDTGRLEASAGIEPLMVTLVPTGGRAERLDLLKSKSSNSGSLKVEDVAPGDYKVFAWEVQDSLLTEYPEFRKLLESKATSVSVRAGETQLIQLKPITAAEVAEARRKLR